MRLLSFLLLVCVSDARGESWREQRLAAELERNPRNVPIILELASLKLEDASGISRESERADALDAVQILYLRAQAIDPQNVDILYHLGMVSWMKVFPAVVTARREAAMEPETPGPVRDRASRAVLNAKYRADVDYAIASLEQAILLDPENSEAMAYLQMAYRARADFKDTRSEWDADQTAAGRWRQRAFTVGTAKLAESPTPHKAPPIASWSVLFLPKAISLDEFEMRKKLVTRRPEASCPASMRGQELTPEVTLSAVIDTDGSVWYLEPLDGPPQAVDAAIEAVRSWIYLPTLLNGNPVRVKTRVVVTFNSCSDATDVRPVRATTR